MCGEVTIDKSKAKNKIEEKRWITREKKTYKHILFLHNYSLFISMLSIYFDCPAILYIYTYMYKNTSVKYFSNRRLFKFQLLFLKARNIYIYGQYDII